MPSAPAVIILAAGSSSRMGQAKQQLIFQGQTLLQRTLKTALATSCQPVLVVLGAHAEAVQPQLEKTEVRVIMNPDWAKGLASSIVTGLQHLEKIAPAAPGALFLLCDQPFLTPDLLQNMLALHQTSGKGIIACSYQNTLGTPVLFSNKYYSRLLQLQGHQGAKKLLSEFPEDMATVPFPQGEIDIDTPEDYQRLLLA